MLMVSPTGARLTQAEHPALPMSLSEIVDETVNCVAAGASALHLHIRDDDGRHSLDPGRYAEALQELDRALPDLPVQVTTESGGRYETASQYKLLATLKPRWISLAFREVARDSGLADRIYALCKAEAIETQHIIYDETDMKTFRRLQDNGTLGPNESVILVLGSYGSEIPSRTEDLDALLRILPPVGRWMACAFGRTEHACLQYAAKCGGDVRVGFENSITDDSEEMWPNVASSVRALVRRLDQTPPPHEAE